MSEEKKKHHIVTISGPSLSGKTELGKELMNQFDFQQVISHTTRPPREGEVDGVDYHFVSKEEFAELEGSQDLVQKAYYNGHHYGVSHRSIMNLSPETPILWIVIPDAISQIDDYCLKNDINKTSIFVRNNRDVLLGRLFNRFKNDLLADVNTYVKRLEDMLNVETKWSEDYDFDILINRFEEDNKQKIVESLAHTLLEKPNLIRENKINIKTIYATFDWSRMEKHNYDAYQETAGLGCQIIIPKLTGTYQQISIFIPITVDAYEGQVSWLYDDDYIPSNMDELQSFVVSSEEKTKEELEATSYVYHSDLVNNSISMDLKILPVNIKTAENIEEALQLAHETIIDLANDFKEFMLKNPRTQEWSVNEGLRLAHQDLNLVFSEQFLKSNSDIIPEEDLSLLHKMMLQQLVDNAVTPKTSDTIQKKSKKL